MANFILFLIAYILFLPLSLINYLYVKNKKGYFLSSALNLDIFANREFRTLWNKLLKVSIIGYNFGKEKETISSALGKNEKLKTLTKTGKALVWILNSIDENHCQKSINNDIV